MLHAKDIMTREVVSIRSDSTVAEAAAAMVAHHISAVPVMEAGRLVGIVSEGDLIHRVEIGTAEPRRSWWLRLFKDGMSLAEEYARSHSRHVADLMTRDVHTVDELTPVPQIADLLDRVRIKRVPVMRGTRVVGIVSRADLVKAIAGTRLGSGESRTDDAGIRARLLDELQGQPWTSASEASVEVEGGIVSFRGTVGSEDERRATRVLAENIEGVRRVEDYRVMIDFPSYAL